MKSPESLQHEEFDQVISLRDAYRTMERFVAAYLERGDTPVSDFLHVYAGETKGGVTSDPAAPSDFLIAAEKVRAKSGV